MSGAELGCVSGRFHGFHREHLAYALAALERCRLLYVGITNADPAHMGVEEAGGSRHRPEKNPFAFHERAEMVRRALLEAGVDPARWRVVPCPVNRPELLPCYVPRAATHWVTTYDEEPWGGRKLELLRQAGYRVEVLWNRPTKGMTGTELRRRLAAGEAVDDLLTPAVRDYLAGLPDLRKRVAGLADGD